MYPVYGSNVNAGLVRKANNFSTTANDVVQVLHEDKEYNFQTFETPNRTFVPKRWRFPNTHYTDGNYYFPFVVPL